jgi:hypothetical protein
MLLTAVVVMGIMSCRRYAAVTTRMAIVIVWWNMWNYSPFKHHRPTDTTLDSFVAYGFKSVSQNNGAFYSPEKYPDTRLLPLYMA